MQESHEEAFMVLEKYLDPKNDVAFKKVFGSEKNKDILIYFLNNILGSFKEDSITNTHEQLRTMIHEKPCHSILETDKMFL